MQLDTLATVQSSRKEIALGPRPGQKIRSGVVPPPKYTTEVPEGGDDAMIDLDD